MERKKVDHAAFTTTLQIGASKPKQVLWYFTNILFFKNAFVVHAGFKAMLLRLFGASVGKGVVIKPSVNIKFPWKLTIGDHSWIGENVWIDNIDQLVIGSNVCISQGALLLNGNHDAKKTGFDLITAPIKLEDGVWIGAKAIVCPGVTCKSHSILTVGSVASKDLEAYSIYKGNPAVFVRERIIE